MDCIYTTNKILFDYFSFTIKNSDVEDVIEMLGLDNIHFVDNYGTKGYLHRYYFDGISIMFGGREEVWCEMTGQGCRNYESHGNNNWFELAYRVLTNENAHMTRLDIAYDDFNGLLDFDAIQKDIFSGNWVSKATELHVTYDVRRSGISGLCCMAGERKCNICCRIYDKAAERNRKDEIPHWIRCELQLRHKHADQFLSYLLCDNFTELFGEEVDDILRLDYLYFAVLNHYLRFIDKDANNDSNVWRKPFSKHWEKFATQYTDLRLSLYATPGVDYNFIRLRHTAEDQYGGLFYTYVSIYGVDKLLDETKKKAPYLNKKYKSLIEQSRLQGTQYEPSHGDITKRINELATASINARQAQLDLFMSKIKECNLYE